MTRCRVCEASLEGIYREVSGASCCGLPDDVWSDQIRKHLSYDGSISATPTSSPRSRSCSP
jgi:hypothetical protein